MGSEADVASIQLHIDRGGFDNWLKMVRDDRLARRISGLERRESTSSKGEQLRLGYKRTMIVERGHSGQKRARFLGPYFRNSYSNCDGRLWLHCTYVSLKLRRLSMNMAWDHANGEAETGSPFSRLTCSAKSWSSSTCLVDQSIKVLAFW